MIEVKQAAFAYNGVNVFKGISFKVNRGEILSILGPNGCGKSTLLSCIAGFLKLNAGVIKVDGQNLKDLSAVKAAQRIGFMQQMHVPVFSYTVREFVAMGRAPYIRLFEHPSGKDYEIAQQAIEQMGLAHLADSPYDKLSGGERQQVLFARLIAQKPMVLLLDEPVSSLDFGNQHKVLKMIKELARQEYTIVTATHTPDHAMLISDQVMLMANGGVAHFGAPQEVFTEKNLTDLYGVKTIVEYVSNAGRSVCIPHI